MPPSPLQLAALRALLDRLIPGDEFPGAIAAGSENYVLNFLRGDGASEAEDILLALTQLDLEATSRRGEPATFARLEPAAQDALLVDLERNRVTSTWPTATPARHFFNRIVNLAHEGYYADPANGGNDAGASWAMLGYDPKIPRRSHATGAPPLDPLA